MTNEKMQALLVKYSSKNLLKIRSYSGDINAYYFINATVTKRRGEIEIKKYKTRIQNNLKMNEPKSIFQP